jgi:hypothetical protein
VISSEGEYKLIRIVLLKGLGKTEQEEAAWLMDTGGAGFLSNGKNVPAMAIMFEKAGE